jgi:transketolase C-terminal domain/subunit
MEVIMAETTKKTSNAKKRVVVRLPRNKGQNARQEEFFSVNGKNYIIKRGEDVEIPEELAEVIRNAELAEDYALRYVDGLAEAEAQKKKEYGI